MRTNTYYRWAILWPESINSPGLLLGANGMTKTYATRAEARQEPRLRNYNEMLRRRKDLRSPPHCWKARRPVKVKITVEQISD